MSKIKGCDCGRKVHTGLDCGPELPSRRWREYAESPEGQMEYAIYEAVTRTAARCAEIADWLTEAAAKEHRFLGGDIASEIRSEFQIALQAQTTAATRENN